MTMPNHDEIDAAIKALQDALKLTPRECRLIARYDQIRAKCRDDPATRTRVIEVLVEMGSTRQTGGMHDHYHRTTD